MDGPSAGLAICLVIYSALLKIPLRQDVGVTGELSIQGREGCRRHFEKIYGAEQAQISKVLLPRENQADIPVDLQSPQIVLVETIEEALAQIIWKE